MEIAAAFVQIRDAFPVTVVLDGTHFRFAQRNGVTMIETRRYDKFRSEPLFCYWLIFEGRHHLVHTASISKLRPMRTIGDSFSPSNAQ